MLPLKDALEPFRSYFFVGSSSDEHLKRAYEAAISIRKLSPGEPQVIEGSRIDDLVQQIEDDMRAHDQGAPVS
jgi:hypothetical protein